MRGLTAVLYLPIFAWTEDDEDGMEKTPDFEDILTLEKVTLRNYFHIFDSATRC